VSKFEGTGFEKLQIVQIQVAAEAGGSGGARNGLSDRMGDAVPDAEPTPDAAKTRLCSEERFIGLGMTVTFADDFKNPA
jgi:hypothetical protein